MRFPLTFTAPLLALALAACPGATDPDPGEPVELTLASRFPEQDEQLPKIEITGGLGVITFHVERENACGASVDARVSQGEGKVTIRTHVTWDPGYACFAPSVLEYTGTFPARRGPTTVEFQQRLSNDMVVPPVTRVVFVR